MIKYLITLKEYSIILDIRLNSVNPCYKMAGPGNECRTLRTINTILVSGAGFSIAVRARKKTIKKEEDRRQERRNYGKLCGYVK